MTAHLERDPGARHPTSSWQAVLFDLDGTLADTVELILASYRHTMRVHLGDAPPDERWLSTIGRPLHDQLRGFARSDAEAGAMLETYVSFQRQIHDEMARPYPGVREVLELLRRRSVPMGVVTSKRSGIARRTLDCCRIRGQFQVVVCADHVQEGKPNPEAVRLALDRLDVRRPERVLFVGDSPFDMHAGRRGGVRTAAALWGPYSEDVLRATGPDYVIAEIGDVLALEP